MPRVVANQSVKYENASNDNIKKQTHTRTQQKGAIWFLTIHRKWLGNVHHTYTMQCVFWTICSRYVDFVFFSVTMHMRSFSSCHFPFRWIYFFFVAFFAYFKNNYVTKVYHRISVNVCNFFAVLSSLVGWQHSLLEKSNFFFFLFQEQKIFREKTIFSIHTKRKKKMYYGTDINWKLKMLIVDFWCVKIPRTFRKTSNILNFQVIYKKFFDFIEEWQKEYLWILLVLSVDGFLLLNGNVWPSMKWNESK